MGPLTIGEKPLYTLPLHAEAKIKGSLHFLFGIIVMILFGVIFIPGTDVIKVIMNVVCFSFGVFFLYIWLGSAFFKKPFIILNEDYLEYKNLFGHKIIYFNNVTHMSLSLARKTYVLDIWSNHEERNFVEKIDKWLGFTYTIKISSMLFSNMDFERLYLTIASKANLVVTSEE